MPHVDGVEHRYADIDGVTIHYAESGSGEPLVLQHGWPQHWYMWRKLIPPLAERFRVICPDLRGHGWSDAPRSGYLKSQLATDLSGLRTQMRRSRCIEASSCMSCGRCWPANGTATGSRSQPAFCSAYRTRSAARSTTSGASTPTTWTSSACPVRATSCPRRSPTSCSTGRWPSSPDGQNLAGALRHWRGRRGDLCRG